MTYRANDVCAFPRLRLAGAMSRGVADTRGAANLAPHDVHVEWIPRAPSGSHGAAIPARASPRPSVATSWPGPRPRTPACAPSARPPLRVRRRAAASPAAPARSCAVHRTSSPHEPMPSSPATRCIRARRCFAGRSTSAGRRASERKQRRDGPEPDPLKCALSRPHGVLVDDRGVLYVGDSEAHRIRTLT